MYNNSGIEVNSAHQLGTVYCHSGSNQSNIGRWISPSGEEIPSDGNDMFQIDFYSSTFRSYTSLTLNEGMVAMVSLCILLGQVLLRNIRHTYTQRKICKGSAVSVKNKVITANTLESHNLPRNLHQQTRKQALLLTHNYCT